MTGKLDVFCWAVALVICSWHVPAHYFRGYLLLHLAADPLLPEREVREPRVDVAEHGETGKEEPGDRVSEQCSHTQPER